MCRIWRSINGSVAGNRGVAGDCSVISSVIEVILVLLVISYGVAGDCSDFSVAGDYGVAGDCRLVLLMIVVILALLVIMVRDPPIMLA